MLADIYSIGVGRFCKKASLRGRLNRLADLSIFTEWAGKGLRPKYPYMKDQSNISKKLHELQADAQSLYHQYDNEATMGSMFKFKNKPSEHLKALKDKLYQKNLVRQKGRDARYGTKDTPGEKYEFDAGGLIDRHYKNSTAFLRDRKVEEIATAVGRRLDELPTVVVENWEAAQATMGKDIRTGAQKLTRELQDKINKELGKGGNVFELPGSTLADWAKQREKLPEALKPFFPTTTKGVQETSRTNLYKRFLKENLDGKAAKDYMYAFDPEKNMWVLTGKAKEIQTPRKYYSGDKAGFEIDVERTLGSKGNREDIVGEFKDLHAKQVEATSVLEQERNLINQKKFFLKDNIADKRYSTPRELAVLTKEMRKIMESAGESRLSIEKAIEKLEVSATKLGKDGKSLGPTYSTVFPHLENAEKKAIAAVDASRLKADIFDATKEFLQKNMTEAGELTTGAFKGGGDVDTFYRAAVLKKNPSLMSKDLEQQTEVIHKVMAKGDRKDPLLGVLDKDYRYRPVPRDAVSSSGVPDLDDMYGIHTGQNRISDTIKIKRMSTDEQAEMFKAVSPDALVEKMQTHGRRKMMAYGAAGIGVGLPAAAGYGIYQSRKKKERKSLLGRRGIQLIGRR